MRQQSEKERNVSFDTPDPELDKRTKHLAPSNLIRRTSASTFNEHRIVMGSNN